MKRSRDLAGGLVVAVIVIKLRQPGGHLQSESQGKRTLVLNLPMKDIKKQSYQLKDSETKWYHHLMHGRVLIMLVLMQPFVSSPRESVFIRSLEMSVAA